MFGSENLLRGLLVAALFLTVLTPASRGQEESYPIPPEAQRHEGVPEGEIKGPFTFESSIFPGTKREYWLYVPAQYDAAEPACTLIVQDGLNRAQGWKLPIICDNLIHSQEMPVTIGIFISPGQVAIASEAGQPRFNRSFEYDSRGDRYARFLLEEIIPKVSQDYNLSSRADDRAIAGASSGGICAFNAAWERPDAFRRVISTIGTFVGLRGGHELAALVRKTEPKPLRVFLQDGSNDLNIYAGDWWTANQDMLSALEWADYDVHHVWGEGGHNGKHGAAIMPEALKWIWQDYPAPVKTPDPSNGSRRVDVLIAGEDWKEVSSGHDFAATPVSNSQGIVFFSDSKAGRIYQIGQDNKTRLFADQTGPISALAVRPNDSLFGVKAGKQIVSFGSDGGQQELVEVESAGSLLALPDGFYCTLPGQGAIAYSTYSGDLQKVLSLRQAATGLGVTTDHSFLHLLGAGRFTLHARINPGGQLDALQEFGYLELPYAARSSKAIGVVVDQQGRFFVASAMGIQVLDQLGRVNFIISSPSNSPMTGIAFGGAKLDQLFVTTAEGVFVRKTNTKGVLSQQEPSEPPKPRL